MKFYTFYGCLIDKLNASILLLTRQHHVFIKSVMRLFVKHEHLFPFAKLYFNTILKQSNQLNDTLSTIICYRSGLVCGAYLIDQIELNSVAVLAVEYQLIVRNKNDVFFINFD